MGKQKFRLEKTPIGLQYVIPGAEKPAAPRKKKAQLEGDQYVLDGAARISTRELIERQFEKPLKPRRVQKPIKGLKLFG